MSGYGYGQEEPTYPCPYCGTPTDADYVDVGVGLMQCGPFHCQLCRASQIGPYDKERNLSEAEKRTGWYEPGSMPGSSANVINGVVVSARAMRAAYREEFVDNPDWGVPGAVEAWRERLRSALP